MSNKYAQLRGRSAGEIEAENLGFQVEEAEQTLASDILATKKSLATAKRQLAEAEGAFPFVSKNIVNAEMEVEGLELGLKKLQGIQERLFGANTDTAAPASEQAKG